MSIDPAPRSSLGVCRQRLGWIALYAALGIAGVWLFSQHLQLLLHKNYSVDEFQYAHGAWLISQGKVIYRDFFEHHFPLIHQLMAVAFVVLDDDPGNLIFLRVLMLPFLVVTVLAVWQLNAAPCGRFALATAVVVLMVPTYSVMATQVRPDPIACAFFAGALAVHTWRRADRRWRGFLSGLLFAAACWTTLKVAYYGLVFPAALVVDLVHNRRARSPYLLSHPGAFLAGGMAVAVPAAVYLTWTGSWGAWFEWCIRWSFVHQWHYPGHFWLRNFTPLFAQSFWLFPLAVVGLVGSVRGLARSEGAAGHPDLLLVGSLVTTLASFVWQSAAYLYSLIPFTVILSIFAGRGVVVAVRFFRSLGGRAAAAGAFATVLLGALLAVEVQRADVALRKLLVTDNAAQHALLTRVHELTRPEEPVYHIAGGQITRPSVHFFYFFEAVVRKLKHDVFAAEVPRAMLETGCVAYMPTDRFGRLPEPLRRFLVTNYQPYDRELWFWGWRYRVPPEGELAGNFFAVRDGRYFIWPLQALGRGQELAVDGRPLEAPILELTAGPHPVAYRGEAEEFFILWLPRNGQPFEPRPDFQPPVDGQPPA